MSKARSNVWNLRTIAVINDPVYGAKCDGVTDDTAAINAAIAALPTGGTLRIPGTPLVSSQILVNKRLRIVFDGGIGINNNNRPGSYLIKASTMTTAAIALAAEGARAEGGGVVAQAGNAGDNILITANSAQWDYGYSEGAARHGWYVDGASNNCNTWGLKGCRAYDNDTDGFHVTGVDGNAGEARGCHSQANGRDGFRSDGADWNCFIACGADNNTGWGIRMTGNGVDNGILGGDYEANTAGDILIDTGEQYCTLGITNRGTVITDNGFYTRRLDRYRDKRGTFHAALRGASGTTQTATAVTISGATATITVAGHGHANGDTMFHLDFANANLNGAFQISNVTANTYDITFRTDSNPAAPSNASGLSVTVQRCGTLSTSRGDYVVEAGVCEAWGTIVTSAVTNLTGSVQIVLPFDCAVLNASANSIGAVDYHAGITYTGRLACLFNQSVAARVANLYDTISGTPGVPANLQGTGLAAATTLVYHIRYRIADTH